MWNPFQRKIWPPNYQNPPWGEAPAIYDHIVSPIDPTKETGLADGGHELPDEPEHDPAKVRFGVGALDGMMTHHGRSKPESQIVKDLYAKLQNATENASERNIEALYSFTKANDLLGLIDALIEEIQKRRDLAADRLRDLSLWFATKGADRKPVKFAIAILGLLRGRDDLEVFLTLGRHDEFTLYSAVAISSNEAYGEKALVRLAKSVDGWGRIHTVERLANTNDPDVKDWLIREGFKNDIMDEYLACICARAGGLETSLEPNEIDDDLLASACDLIEALISGEGGPAEGLADYEHSCSVIRSILRHGKARFATASHYLFLSTLKQGVDDYPSDKYPIKHDWSKEDGEQIAAELTSLLSGKQWKAVIAEALETGNRQAFWAASRVSQKVGIDPWPYFYQRTENGENYWWDLMRSTPESDID